MKIKLKIKIKTKYWSFDSEESIVDEETNVIYPFPRVFSLKEAC